MVVYKKGHKNSKGEKAEWCIVSHATHKILSSHKSKSAAEKHLGDMRKFKHMKERAVNMLRLAHLKFLMILEMKKYLQLQILIKCLRIVRLCWQRLKNVLMNVKIIKSLKQRVLRRQLPQLKRFQFLKVILYFNERGLVPLSYS